MKIVLLCVVAFVMVVQLPREGEAVCCYGKGALVWNLRCKDCSKASPFCAKGKGCNIFGCNCMGGCREGPCPSHHHHDHKEPVHEAPIGRDYEGSYESAPNGDDAAVDPVLEEYDIRAGSSGSESQTPSSSNADVSGYDVYSGGETEMSNEMKVPESDVYSDGESEMSNEMKVPESDVPSGSETEMSSSDDYNGVDAGYDDAISSDESEPEITSADDVISSADENRDGYMDIDEAERFLVKRGLASSGYRAKRSLRAIDLNNDNYISAEEIELYED